MYGLAKAELFGSHHKAIAVKVNQQMYPDIKHPKKI